MSINLTVGRPATIIYLDRSGVVTQRLIEVRAVSGGRVRAYCHTARAPRVFLLESILAARPANLTQTAQRARGSGYAG